MPNITINPGSQISVGPATTTFFDGTAAAQQVGGQSTAPPHAAFNLTNPTIPGTNRKPGPLGNQGGQATTTTSDSPDDLIAASRPPGVYQSEIRLVGQPAGGGGGSVVVFRATPDVEENATALYITIDNIAAPSSFLFWIGSPSRTFSINAKLVSRTQAEADENFRYVNILRSWRMPIEMGGGDNQTPETLRLWGYEAGGTGQFLGIPCVMVSLNLTYNSESDYITTAGGVQMPIIMPVSIQLRESHTIKDMEQFDYGAYKAGVLTEWT